MRNANGRDSDILAVLSKNLIRGISRTITTKKLARLIRRIGCETLASAVSRNASEKQSAPEESGSQWQGPL